MTDENKAPQFRNVGEPMHSVIVDTAEEPAAISGIGLISDIHFGDAAGQIFSLDDVRGDGVLDPLRFSATPADGIEQAVLSILQANPFAGHGTDFEALLRAAISYGVSVGATCVGDALRLSLDSDAANPRMVAKISALYDRSPMFRALIAHGDTADRT
jgi:hypothetical protein